MTELKKISGPRLKSLLEENINIKEKLINEKYLTNTLVRNSCLEYINEERIEISACKFENVVFSECCLRNVDLADIIFENCDLSNIDFFKWKYT